MKFVCLVDREPIRNSIDLIFDKILNEVSINRTPIRANVQINVGDSDQIRTVKKLILDTTSLIPLERPSSADVRRRLGRPEIVPPNKWTRLKAGISNYIAEASFTFTQVCLT